MAKRRVIVYPPSSSGGRRVRVNGLLLGRAYSLQDLNVLLEHAGTEGWIELDPTAPSLVESAADLIEWRGGGPETWGPDEGLP